MKWALLNIRGWGNNPPINPIFEIGSAYLYLPPTIISISFIKIIKGEYTTGFT
jgi:hypothetical protein